MESKKRPIHINILIIIVLLLSCFTIGLAFFYSPIYKTPMFIYLNSESQSPDYSSSLPSESVTPKPNDVAININTASFEELQLLPGIGPTIAQNIIDYRNSIGEFTSVDELLNVDRIGQKTLDKLRPYITLK